MDNFSPDATQFIRLIVALVLVLGLMGGLAFVLKKLGIVNNINIKNGDKRRLKVIESLPLDARRRLVIIQCDDQQHLLILGTTQETVISENISPVDASPDSKPSTS